MAINEENAGQSSQQNTQRAQQEQPKQGLNTSATWSFHQQNVTGSPIAAGVGGEYFTKFRNALADVYKEIADGVQISIIALNRQNFPALKFSALVVAAKMPDVNDSIVTFHTLILEATGEKLGSAFRQVDNQNIQVNRATSDAWDTVLNQIAQQAVQAEFRDSHVIPASSMVVPAHVTVEKKEIVENIARNAAMACVSVINTATQGFSELNLANMDRDCRFVIDVAFGNHQVQDIVGNPQRSSVLINYSSQKKTANSIGGGYETVNVPDSVARICELSGFLNPIWAPLDNGNGFGFQNYQQPNVPRPTQKFAAEFVITNVKTEYATSPAAVLFAISSFLALVDSNAWIQGLLPKQRGARRGEAAKVDITDIGALNITANVGNDSGRGGFGAPIDMSLIQDDLMEVNNYLVSIFRPGVVISIDCPEAQSQSWYLDVFAAAASGDQAAYDQIFEAANELTDGHFERFFKHGTPMFTNIVRVPLGHYLVGEQCLDIRNIDYTAIANLFQGTPSVIHDYSNTFVERPGVSAIRNLAIREGIINDALNQQCTIDGYAARPTLSGDFVSALSTAIAECNLPVTVNTPLNQDQLRSATPTPGFISGSLASNTRTFGTGYATQGRPQQYRFGAFRR